MAFAEFEGLLKQTIGLDAASIGASAIERAVQERLSACGLADRARVLAARARVARPSCRS